MTYQEFSTNLQKCGSKPHKISRCFGARDAWKWVRKNKWQALKGQKCSSSVYGAVVDEVNKVLVDQLFAGHAVVFPHQMGSIELTARQAKVSDVGGKVKSNYRVDWKKTLEYWYEDPAAMKERHRIKKIQKYIYSIVYSKHQARYKNQRYYMFRVNRSLVKTLGKAIENQKLNAFIY